VLVAVTDEASRERSEHVAGVLRARGIPTEVAPSAAKFGKQIRHADRRGIPFVWFPGAAGEPDSVKDLRSGEQGQADAGTWSPPEADRHPRVVRVDPTTPEEGTR
jgi:histidyl-tRNA synthetase